MNLTEPELESLLAKQRALGRIRCEALTVGDLDDVLIAVHVDPRTAFGRLTIERVHLKWEKHVAR